MRRHKPTGTALEEVVYQPDKQWPTMSDNDRDLQVPFLRAGQPVADPPTLEQSRKRVKRGLVSLPWEGLKLSHGEPAIPTVFVD
jgi:nicotinate phosphoribosyltransferase